MAIFKRSEKNSGPQAKVFTPDDLGALGTPAPAAGAAASTMTMPTPQAPPVAPMVDGVIGTPGLSMPNSLPPQQPSSMPVSPFVEAPAPEPTPLPELPTPEPPTSIPVQAPPAPAPAEILAPPPTVESEFVPSAPSAIMPEYVEPAPAAPEPVLSADRTPTPEPSYQVPEPEAPAPEPESAAHVDPAMQELAHRVSQALVDLEELRGQKEDLESQLAALQRQHGDLDRKIEQQRKVVTELLAQVHKVIVGDEAPGAPAAEEKPDTPPAQPRPHRRRS